MLKVGLTGGIGSGKSAVSRLLMARGAVVVDADLLAREVVEPGTTGLARVVAEFGERVRRPDGTLDREALGRTVFGDAQARQRLNAIVHPLIAERTAERVDRAEREGALVLVHDVALLVENGMTALYDEVVVVAATLETQLDRLVRLRGMTEPDARARIEAQAPLADKLAVATRVVHNDGPLAELEPQVEALWQQLVEASRTERRAASPP